MRFASVTLDPKQRRLLGWGIAAALGGFIFGYQQAVISAALLFVRRDFGLSGFQQGLLVGVLPLGAMVGGLLAGRMADALGRRRTLLIDAVVFAVGTVLAVIAPSFAVLVLARAIAGFGVGAASSVGPLYLSEIAPRAVRGRLVTMNQLLVTLGIVCAYGVGLIFAGSGSWRPMFAVALLPIAALLVGMLRSPESPAWLHGHGRHEQARQVLLEVADEREVERLLDGGEPAAEGAHKRLGVRALWRSAAAPALAVAVTLAAIQQLAGINAVIAYAPSIMQRTGLAASNSILYSIGIGAINVVATIASVRLVDRAGRRPLLLVSIAGSFVSLALLGLTFAVSLGSSGSWLALICLLGYVASFALGLGPIFWLLAAELFPPDARAAGASAATATVWFTSFVVGLAFLPVANAIGEGPTFWIFAAVCAFAFVFVRRFVPETAGRTAGEIQAELQRRWGHAPHEEQHEHVR
ncbi:MAG: csbC [Conexibacter sp.]|nr:csbC [Conexibacter sp.]